MRGKPHGDGSCGSDEIAFRRLADRRTEAAHLIYLNIFVIACQNDSPSWCPTVGAGCEALTGSEAGKGSIKPASNRACISRSSFSASSRPRLCENAQQPRMRRIVFSISFFGQLLPVQLTPTSTKLRRKFYTQVERQSFHTASTRSGRRKRVAFGTAMICCAFLHRRR